jgi:ActR/RegA family two-component response regulator
MVTPDPHATSSTPTVLVVAKDERFRRMLVIAFGLHGMTVLTAASKEEALDIYQENRVAVSAVLLARGATATIAALRALNPKLRCRFISAAPGKAFLSPRDLANVL